MSVYVNTLLPPFAVRSSFLQKLQVAVVSACIGIETRVLSLRMAALSLPVLPSEPLREWRWLSMKAQRMQAGYAINRAVVDQSNWR